MASTSRLDISAGTVLILPGIALALIGPRFDGFAKGMCQGAGVMLILLGVWLVGSHLRRPRTDEDGDALWLPSRDAGRGPGPEHDPDPR